MELEHGTGARLAYVRARRAYELGRLASALYHGGIVTCVIALVAWAAHGTPALALLPASLLTWVFVYWRGTALLRGAAFGLLGGSATALLPLSVLRPCCDVSAPPGVDCCTMPGLCVLAGACVGMLVAAFVPLERDAAWHTSAGVVLGMASVAVLKCATLFLGEAVGLLGGLSIGVLVSAVARGALRTRGSLRA